MTTYNTGNPIGSKDARDLYDNAQNLDNFSNGSAASYTDRLGVSRRSLSGIDSAADNVLNSIGYAVPVTYASGISLTLTSQTVEYNGVIYAPKSSALPFSTSSWGADQFKFRAIQVTDADLITYNPAGASAVATTVQSKLRETVSVTNFSSIQTAANYASSVNLPLELKGDTYEIATLTLTSPLEIVGRGTISKTSGTTGHLINSSSDLVISGRITLDQNAANCPNPSASYNTDCTINHSGAKLILNGVACLPSVSSNINSSATAELTLNDCAVTGGWLCVRAAVATTCRVQIKGGKYSSSTVYDNIQVLNSRSYLIDGVESFSSKMSGIVASNSSLHGVISNCHVYDNKKDITSGEGGAGIVCSVSVGKTTITGNVCRGNQATSIVLDTTTAVGASTDAYIVVNGNVCDGENALSGTGYANAGIIINGAQKAIISNNLIRKAVQGLLLEDSNNLVVSGNSVDDCGDGYFLQTLRVNGAVISGNNFSVCMGGVGNAGAIGFQSSSGVNFNANSLYAMTGDRNAIRVTNTTDYQITNNFINKESAGVAYMIWISGVSTDGYIANNRFKSSLAAWQYYINATSATVTGTVTKNNEITCTGIKTNPNRYIYNGTAIVADGDTINNVKDYWSAAPTICTVKQGQVAGIAGALKMWNGSAWV